MKSVQTIIADDEQLVRERIKDLISTDDRFILLDEASDGRSALRKIKELQPDLVLLDIKMPEMDAFEVIEKLDTDNPPIIVFITAFDEYSLKAFEANALDYLLKPLDKERFTHVMDKSYNKVLEKHNADFGIRVRQLLEDRYLFEEKSKPHKLSIKSGKKFVFIDPDEIILIESRGNYLFIHIESDQWKTRNTLTKFIEKLNRENFFRIHNSHIVNKNFVTEMQHLYRGEYLVKLKNGKTVTSSRGYKQEIQRLLQSI